MQQSNPFDQFDNAPGPQGVVIKDADPRRAYEAPLAAADLAAKRVALANAPIDTRKAVADAAKAEAEARLATIQAAQGVQNKGLSPEVRANAISGYKSAESLDKIIADLKTKFRAGPGATKGLSGLTDYLPYTENQQFDNEGNAARGIVGQALGFTGGQLNTATEANMSVGPYLPQSSDRDAVALDKIKRLEELRDTARERAIAQLGGIPDANGNVTPIPANASSVAPTQQREQGPAFALPAAGAGQPPIPPAPPAGETPTQTPILSGGGGPNGALALNSDGYTTVPDPTRKGAISTLDKMLRSGVPDNQIQAFAANLDASPASVAAALDFRRKNPTYTGAYNLDALGFKKVPAGLVQRGMNAAAQSPLGAFGINAADAVTAGNLDSLIGMTGGNADLARAGMAGVSQANPISSMAGNIAGGALAAAGTEAGLGAGAARLGMGAVGANGVRAVSPWVARGADALYGAAAGAGSADNGDRLTGATLGAIGGAGGGMFGRGVSRAGGALARGVTDPSVTFLRARGVPLTIGQAAGGIGKGIEDRLAGLPVVGDMINNRRREGFRGFNTAAFNEGLAPIGQTAAGNVGEEGIDTARQAVSGAYDNALDGVRTRMDAPFVAGMRPIIDTARELPDPMAGNALYTLRTRVRNSFGPNRELTGNDFQQSLRGLARDAKAVQAQPYGHDFGNIANDARGELEGILQRQAPHVLPAYNNANEAYRNVSVLRDAVNAARNGSRTGETGLVAPSQLADAAASNSKRFGGTHGTTQQPFFELTRAGQEVLPSKVPDSGTAGRLAMLALPGAAALGGGAGYAAGDTQGGATAGIGAATLGSLLYTRRGQQLLVSALLDRPDAVRGAGRQLTRAAPLAGMFGAGAGATLLPPQ